MRDDIIHADISHDFYMRVYSTEPPEEEPKGSSLFFIENSYYTINIYKAEVINMFYDVIEKLESLGIGPTLIV